MHQNSLLRLQILSFMAQLRWLARLSHSRLMFCLLLPLVGALFWVSTGWVTSQVLSQTYPTTTQLTTENQQQVHLSLTLTVLSIDADIGRRAKNTEVTVQTADSSLQELEFEYPVTEFAEIEAAIAKELNLPKATVRDLIRYRLN